MAASIGSRAVSALVVKPAVKRLAGERASRREAALAAVSVGVGLGAAVHRFLRSGDEEEERR